ncbi:PH domain-containing protein [Plantactinospora sp. WMMB782]|uniref:PH domain-containing protein n=1 Tax=Plantactinospora sp. WMMB782 TaxID=3404121 RepID=UPI003B93A293
MGPQQPYTGRPPTAPEPDSEHRGPADGPIALDRPIIPTAATGGPAAAPSRPVKAAGSGPQVLAGSDPQVLAGPGPQVLAGPGPGGSAGSLGLRPLRHRVDRRAIGWWSARVIVGVAPLVAALSVGYVMLPATRSWLGPILLVAVPTWLAYLVVVPSWRYAVHGWEVTPDAVYAVSGWFVREWRAAPISRIQTVDTVRGPLEQLFGLATVTVTTASASGPVVLVGLDADLAARTAGRLTEIVRQTAGDAT